MYAVRIYLTGRENAVLDFGNPVVFPKQHERVGAFYPVPGLDEPGLGVTVNEEWVVAAASEGAKEHPYRTLRALEGVRVH
jgi:hypothetical protein